MVKDPVDMIAKHGNGIPGVSEVRSEEPGFDIIRFFDLLIALTALILLIPLLVLVAIAIKFSSKGPVIFCQQRVGKNNRDFTMYKFRTMHHHRSSDTTLTIGNRDERITKTGYYLRKFKIDELPQLYNVVAGDMSMVGPRPELRKFVACYTAEQMKILILKPGITDYASIYFRNESEILRQQEDPEAYYVSQILPIKIELNRKYLDKKNIGTYFLIIFKTLSSLWKTT